MNIHDLAQAYLAHFKPIALSDEVPMVCLCDDAPENLRHLVRQAHDGMPPDEYRFAFVEDALTKLAECLSRNDAYDQLEADSDTRDLTTWLGSRPIRIDYLTEALKEYGALGSGFDLLVAAQLIERQEVFDVAYDSLIRILEEKEG